ncbi:MAG: SpoIIE family protein phosphatase [Acidobacteria bacterium]|nr:SpoIIE family protein phosphatase [Acidobacteriota bacterium]
MAKRFTMDIPLGEIFRSLMPITSMGRAMLAGIIVWFLNWVFTDGTRIFGSQLLKTLVDLASFLALIPLFYFTLRYFRLITGKLLWRLRRRLIVTYLLIGVIPIALLVLLIVLIGYVVIMQSGANLVARQLDSYLEQSHSTALSLSRELNNPQLDIKKVDLAQLRSRLQEKANSLAPVIPDIVISVRDRNTGLPIVSARGISSISASATQPTGITDENIGLNRLPSWFSGEYHGLVIGPDDRTDDRTDDRPHDPMDRRRVTALHLVVFGAASDMLLQLSFPIGDQLCRQISQNAELVVRLGMASIPLIMTSSGPSMEDSGIREREKGQNTRPPGPGSPGRLPIFKEVKDWPTGVSREVDVLTIDSSFLLPSELWRSLEQFRAGSVFGDAIIWAIGGLGVFFLIITLTAIISAIVLTSSITGAIHNLYEGTKRVEVGDLSHEIPIKSQDQIGDLSNSFNQMTRSIRELMRVSAEKQRLDQEMKIAAQVQSQLFPKSEPLSDKLEFAPGICIPARLVSGDYYDYLNVAPGCIGIVVADVCGKGVSAALMMANLQANLRGQVQAYFDSRTGQTDSNHLQPEINALKSRSSPVRKIVERVNQQIADSMMDSSFITFFFAEFDERQVTLTYTNAGHNPPLLLRRDSDGRCFVEKLETGGTVLGLFKDSEYQDSEVQLTPGDVLVAFTDGLIEARNPLNNEEYGEENLIQCIIDNGDRTATEIENIILESVREWTLDSEQEDDLTLVIFKVK